MKREYKTPDISCLKCGYKFEYSSFMDPNYKASAPVPGNFSVCLNCGYAAVFTEGMKLRHPNDEEKAWIAGSKHIMEMQIGIAAIVTKDLRERQKTGPAQPEPESSPSVPPEVQLSG